MNHAEDITVLKEIKFVDGKMSASQGSSSVMINITNEFPEKIEINNFRFWMSMSSERGIPEEGTLNLPSHSCPSF